MGPTLAGFRPGLPPRPVPVRLPYHLGFLNASLLCVVSCWGLGKNVAPGLLRCLGYVGVFPVGERYALCLLSWKRMPGTVVPVQGQMSR